MKTKTCKTCKTCKHWEIETEHHLLPRHRISGGFCENEKFRENVSNSDYENAALVYDYYEGGSFWTGPDFGCVHHEEKEEQSEDGLK